jgi:hypothetical protein
MTEDPVLTVTANAMTEDPVMTENAINKTQSAQSAGLQIILEYGIDTLDSWHH